MCSGYIIVCQHFHCCSAHCAKKPVTTMLTYPWKCTVLHCNHLGNTWKPLVLMTWRFDYCPSASEGDNQSARSSAPVVSRCFPGGYNVKLYISRGRLAWWLLAFLCCGRAHDTVTSCLAVPCKSQLFRPRAHFKVDCWLMTVWPSNGNGDPSNLMDTKGLSDVRYTMHSQ